MRSSLVPFGVSRRGVLGLAALALVAGCTGDGADARLLNASFDSTRELFDDVNAAFVRDWRQRTGQRVTIHQSHAGSGKQARSVIEGLQADVVSLGLGLDVDKIASQSDRLPKTWRDRFPMDSSPFASTIVFVVRAGNPRGVRDWDDLVLPGIQIITPSPAVSGGARWNYLAAWAHALGRSGGDEAKALAFVTALFRNVPLLDSGARAASITFAQRRIGDVLIAWESEARLLLQAFGEGRFQIIYPSTSIAADLPVTYIDRNVDRHGTRPLAEAYVRFLYQPEVQRLAARHHFRPRLPSVARETAAQFPATRLVSIDDLGGWPAVQKKHFDRGGLYDRIEGSL